MSQSARNTYLENEIRTATPQRLRKLLLDGAWRFCHQASDAIERNDSEAAITAIERANLILSELLSGIKPGYDVSKSVTELYVFLIKELVVARRELSAERLQGIINVLDVERETWRLVCEAVPHRLSPSAGPSREILSSDAAQILTKSRVSAPPASASRSSFSMDG